ncbi:hypothetical protein CQW23_14018 [Capsicum baccatum]|uniref:Lipin/Ned1/Smp2 (LNS2) domain-containing protein n=1 Tax=Capsicum baccatum TaxID=33114 RepID=A0A2G2WI87_CAPBA|nr:hypothetical protein CQW23_14018 [Capsicum baccatum]
MGYSTPILPKNALFSPFCPFVHPNSHENDIKALFPSDKNPFPFYAGFGNRHTDEISYLKVGIPKGIIDAINPKGQIIINRHVATKSYTSLHSLVTAMFPAIFSCEQVAAALGIF